MFRWGVSCSLPSGPSTLTTPPATWTLTFAGTGTGCLPIRDIASSSRLPDPSEDFAAQPLRARLAVAHHPARSGHDTDAEPVQHRLQQRHALVEPAARP